MSIGFWKNLKKPFFVLAPMADVTDAAFRRVIAKRGSPDVMWTEFVSADGLVRATPEGKAKLMKDLIYVDEERPIVAQLFSAHPEYMKEAAKLVRSLGFDGIDINMGCPDRSIEKQGAGAALIRTPDLAREVIRAAKEGAKGDGVEIPVSVKTRVGYNTVVLDEWLPEILKESPAAVTIHARTRKEMSKVPANWDLVRQAVEIRDRLGSSALILGNGDVKDIADAREKAESTGADGIMLGRAIFGNPWLFNESRPKSSIPLHEQLEALKEHVQLFDEILGGTKSFAIMKKHFKSYVEGFDGAKEIREKLMNATNPQEVTSLLSAMIEATASPR
jgi:nifR3 family TIM-barrel protein